MTVGLGPSLSSLQVSLTHVEVELCDDGIPFDDTAARLMSVTETVAQMIAANLGSLPGDIAALIAKAQLAVLRRDLLASRDFILDALVRAQRRPHAHMRAAKFRSSRPVKLA